MHLLKLLLWILCDILYFWKWKYRQCTTHFSRHTTTNSTTEHLHHHRPTLTTMVQLPQQVDINCKHLRALGESTQRTQGTACRDPLTSTTHRLNLWRALSHLTQRLHPRFSNLRSPGDPFPHLQVNIKTSNDSYVHVMLVLRLVRWFLSFRNTNL